LRREIAGLQRKGYKLGRSSRAFRGDGLDLSTANGQAALVHGVRDPIRSAADRGAA